MRIPAASVCSPKRLSGVTIRDEAERDRARRPVEVLQHALTLLGMEPQDDTRVHWTQERSDEYVVYVAASFGLLRYRFAEMPASTQWELTLGELTPWSDVDARVKTVTRHQGGQSLWSSIELNAKGLKVEHATGRNDHGFAEFLGEVIRRSSKATL